MPRKRKVQLKETNTDVASETVKPAQLNPSGERSFCVSLLKDGQTFKSGSMDPQDFVHMIDLASVTWIDYWAVDFNKEAPEIASLLGFSNHLIGSLLKCSTSAYEDFDSELGLLLPAVHVQEFDVHTTPLLILMRNNFILTIHTAEIRRFLRVRRYAETFMKKIPTNASPADRVTMLLIRLIDENNSRNFDHLREIEASGDHLHKILSDQTTPRNILGPEIYKMKHALITYLGALWATLDVLNTLRYGDPELLTDDDRLLERVGALSTDVNGQISLAEHLSEVLASGLEVLQSIYNNQLQVLNNKLALLVAYMTIFGTAFLVPNTIATALSNPAFGMTPSDAWWYVILLVVSTIASAFIAYWWVKEKGWFPSKVE